MNKNKVKFGLKNVYYAKATIDAEANTATYDTPKRIPGAVSLSMDAQGDTTNFYADDGVYFTVTANNGYQGDLEVALYPDEFKKDILGYVTDKNGVLIEDTGAIPKPFALIFEFSGDVNARRHCLFNCTSTRPAVSSKTKAESVEVQTETSTITAAPIHCTALDKDMTKADCDKDSSAYNSWFSEVYTPEKTEE